VTETVVVTAEVDGAAVASATLLRRYVAADVRVTDVRDEGVVGTFLRPPSTEPLPGLLVLGGSEGRIPRGLAAALASNGYATLALAYFDPTGELPGVPAALSAIPLETFSAAIDWLRSEPAVDDARIGIVGASRGAEAALLVASERPEIGAVVAYAPSHVVWPDLAGAGPAWSRGGGPVPYVPVSPAPGPLVDVFSAALADEAAVDQAAIPVERIEGAVLLVSGEDDQLWPSAAMGEEVIARLEANDYPHRYRHRAYRGAGHLIVVPYHPTTTLAEPPGGRFALGGNAADAARASADHWPRVLRFLDRNL
jgi:dienelactone hydrolase